MSKPTKLMSLFDWKLDGKSVCIDMPTISTAWSSRPCSCTKSSLTTIAAAPPSEVGQHCSFVSGSCTIFAPMMSSRE